MAWLLQARVSFSNFYIRNIAKLEIRHSGVFPSSHMQQEHLLLPPNASAPGLAQWWHWVKPLPLILLLSKSHQTPSKCICCGMGLAWIPHTASFGGSPLALLFLVLGWWGEEDCFVIQHRNNSVFIFKFDTSSHRYFFTVCFFPLLSKPHNWSQPKQ